MSWLIDGHNLIPCIPGLALNQLDDEMRLVEMLQVYSRRKRRAIEVYFDGAPAGQSGTRQVGMVKAVFIRAGKTADEAIIARIRKLGNAARNSTIVSSDRRVRAEAVDLHVPVISSQAFSNELLQVLQGKNEEPNLDASSLTPTEVEEWLQLFRKKPPQ